MTVAEVGRWATAGAVVAAAHLFAALAILSDPAPPEMAADPPAAIEIELEPAAPTEVPPTQLPPAPAQAAVPPSPIPPAEAEHETIEPQTAPAELEDVEPESATAPAPPETQVAAASVEPALLPVRSEQVEMAAPEAALSPAAPAMAAAKPAEAETAALEPQSSVEVARTPRARPDVVPEQARRAQVQEKEARDEPEPGRSRAEPKPRRKAAAPPPSAPSAPAAELRRAEKRAAPDPGAQAGRKSVSPDRWRSAVFRHLERHKRYPRAAEARRISGTVRVRLTIDANGAVVGFRLAGSSGHPELDEATAGMIRRASPVPAPPPELYRPGLTIEVPVRFTAR
jgi:protein TonB